MSYLSPDLILEILWRLPARDLLRWRCVSKSWCALIDSPYFIKLHLNHSLHTRSNLGILIGYSDRDSIHFDKLDFDKLGEAERLKHSIEKDYDVVGSSNGLIALLDLNKDVALWNPSTRKYRQLPSTLIGCRGDFCIARRIIYGFSHDSVTDDYKVVRMVPFFDADYGSLKYEVEVYSLKANSWRRIQDLPYCLDYVPRFRVCARNALHWVVRKEAETEVSCSIVAFDLGSEEYRLVPPPEFDSDYFQLSELGGCLGLTYHYYQRADIWIMKEYGAKESWTKLYSVSEWHFHGVIGLHYVKPLAYSKNHEKVLMLVNCNMFCWYDLKSNKVMKVKSQVSALKDAFLWVESLVSPAD